MKYFILSGVLLGGMAAFPAQAGETGLLEKAQRAAHQWLQFTSFFHV